MTTEITARDKLLLYVVGMLAFIFFFVQFMLTPALEASDEAAASLAEAQQAQIAAAAANQPSVAAGIVFIGDSRMVTLKDAVERNLGSCAAAVVAKNGSRHEWLHDTGIPQADKIIGKGSRVVINMGVNGLLAMGDILLIGGDLNGPTLGGICQSGLGKQLWDEGRTRKIIQRPLKRTADSADYLAGQPRLPDGRRRPCIGRSTL